MSEVQTQRAVESERLTTAAEDDYDEELRHFQEENLHKQRPLSSGVRPVKVGAGVPSAPSPCSLSLDRVLTDTARVKEELEEKSIKQEEEGPSVSTAVCMKNESFSLCQQRQTEHRKAADMGSDPEAQRSEGQDRPLLRCLAAQRSLWDNYNQLQIRDRSTAAAAQTSDPPIDYSKPYSCSICKKAFAKKAQLDVHTRTHTGEKPYSCYFCEKLFAKKSNLDLHVRLHTGEKPYSCNFCEKTFAQISNLKVHKRTHTGEKPYSCSECEKTFAQKNTLKAHMKTHITDKLHSCEICAKSFLHKTNLDVHMRIHTGEKPYSCDYCEKTFTQNSNLKAHLRIHTGEKPYGCTMCEKTFAQKGTLDGHVKLHLQKASQCLTGGDAGAAQCIAFDLEKQYPHTTP